MNTEEKQREITRLCAQTAVLLLQHGAESTLVAQIASRLGLALGVESVECALTPNAVVITTLQNNHCITTTRQSANKGVNMGIVTEVQRIVITAEHRIYDLQLVRKKLDNVSHKKYPPALVVPMVGLSCASFAHLSGGSALVCFITFIASAVAMYVRHLLELRHYKAVLTFAVSGFVASLISGLALKFHWGENPQIALASSVLLLVPGFPLINSLADILKGHVSMGIARWTVASILTLGACIGITFALSVLNITRWGG